MKPLIFGLLLIAVLAAAPANQKFTGTITDSMCPEGDHSHMRMGPTDTDCSKACVSYHDAMYVLFDGKEIYTLSDQKTPERFAGKKVTVTGALDAKTKAIQVDTITAADQAGPIILNLLSVTDNLDRAEEFYHRLLGLESNAGDPRARLVWYAESPFLDDIYRTKGNSRNFMLRVPGSDLLLEIEQFSGAKGKRLNSHIQDPGAQQLIFTTHNIDILVGWLTKGGAKVLTAGGKPVSVKYGAGTARAILFQDFNGFFVKLVQPDGPPPAPGVNGAPPASFINGVTIGITVEDTEKTARYYREVLGVDVKSDAPFVADSDQMAALGLKGAQYRESIVALSEKSPPLHFFEFKGVDRKQLNPEVADPNSVLVRFDIHDINKIATRVKAAGGEIVNPSGAPSANGKTLVLVAKDPNGVYSQFFERNILP